MNKDLKEMKASAYEHLWKIAAGRGSSEKEDPRGGVLLVWRRNINKAEWVWCGKWVKWMSREG